MEKHTRLQPCILSFLVMQAEKVEKAKNHLPGLLIQKRNMVNFIEKLLRL